MYCICVANLWYASKEQRAHVVPLHLLGSSPSLSGVSRERQKQISVAVYQYSLSTQHRNTKNKTRWWPEPNLGTMYPEPAIRRAACPSSRTTPKSRSTPHPNHDSSFIGAMHRAQRVPFGLYLELFTPLGEIHGIGNILLQTRSRKRPPGFACLYTIR